MAKVLSLVRPLSQIGPGLPETTQSLRIPPRGAITEILGKSSTGRTAFAHSLLATATRNGEVAAVIDCNDAFDPSSARKAGSDLGKVLWVQCGHRLDVALKATDLILHSGGFGILLLDLCDAAPAALQRVPTSYWYRFQRAIEHTSSVLLVLARHSLARSSSARQIALEQRRLRWRGEPPFQTIERLDLDATSQKPVDFSSVPLEAFAEMGTAEV